MRAGERGAAAVELVIALPALVLLLAVTLAVGRIITVKSGLLSIAREAARAASQAPDISTAEATGDQVARREASLAGLTHDRLVIEQDGGEFARGGRYGVTVSYEVPLADLPGLRLVPASLTVTARQVETVEQHSSR